jgi:hypothetical protein
VALEARELERAHPQLDVELQQALDEAVGLAAAMAPPERVTARYRGLLGPDRPGHG